MTTFHSDAALQQSLQGGPLLRLTLRDRDYGMPCPEDRWEVKAAIDKLLKPSLEGMVLDLDVLETADGDCDDVLLIGVVDIDSSVPKLHKLLKGLQVSAGATLIVDGTEKNLVSDLKPRAELVAEMTEVWIQMLLAESRACAPSDWQGGTLTIQCDGQWLGYQLKNTRSNNAAPISGRLQSMCEETAVFMWKNGHQWREAVLDFEGKEFTINFSYVEPSYLIPRGAVPAPAPPVPAKPFWKFW